MTTFFIKILALIAMLLDHIGYYFYWQFPDLAVWLRLVGRISFPLFLFAFVWGYFYSRGRRKNNLTKLYISSIIMALLNLAFLTFSPRHTRFAYPQHNIFLNFIFTALVVSILENWGTSKKRAAVILGVGVASTILHLVVVRIFNADEYLAKIISGFLPSVFYLEYDFWFVILGVALYFFRNSKLAILATMIAFSGLIFSTTPSVNGFQQGAMIFALPVMLLYNGKKGADLGWIFYAFYPVHIVVLYLLFLSLTALVVI